MMILDKIRGWLVRHRDQTNVTYSRFGRPGEEHDDKPPPTVITIAPFDDNAPQFMWWRCWHITKAAAAVACIGMSIVILSFVSGFFEFNWYEHDRGVDLSALLFMFAYLTLGVLVHYYVLYAIKKSNAYYLIPFIVVYTVLCAFEFIVVLSLMFKMLEVQPAYKHRPFMAFLIGTSASVIVQVIMLSVIVRCRQYLSAKSLHDLELKVAEMSKQRYPAIRIVVSDSTLGISNPNSVTEAPTSGHVTTPPAANGTANGTSHNADVSPYVI